MLFSLLITMGNYQCCLVYLLLSMLFSLLITMGNYQCCLVYLLQWVTTNAV